MENIILILLFTLSEYNGIDKFPIFISPFNFSISPLSPLRDSNLSKIILYCLFKSF